VHDAAVAHVPTGPGLPPDGRPDVVTRLHVPDVKVSTTGPGPHAVHVVDVEGHETELSWVGDGSAVSGVHVVPANTSTSSLPPKLAEPTATQAVVDAHETEPNNELDAVEACVAVHTPATSTSMSATPWPVEPTATHRFDTAHEIEASESVLTPAGRASVLEFQAPLASLDTNASDPEGAWAVPEALQAAGPTHDTPDSVAEVAPAGSSPTCGDQAPLAKVSTRAWETVVSPEDTL